MSVDAEIREVLLAKASALVDRSAERLAAVIDPAFVYIDARGRRLDREQYVRAFCGAGGIRFLAQTFHDLEVRDFGGFAVAAIEVHDDFEHESGTFSGVLRSLCVFRRSGPSWLWCAGQTMRGAKPESG